MKISLTSAAGVHDLETKACYHFLKWKGFNVRTIDRGESRRPIARFHEGFSLDGEQEVAPPAEGFHAMYERVMSGEVVR